MNERVFVSTGAFQSKTLRETLKLAQEFEITNVELASGVRLDSTFEENLRSVISEPRGPRRYLVHNYFPPENQGLVINLASKREDLRQASLNFCKNSMDLCTKVGSPFYSVHSGFCIDYEAKDLGNDQAHLKRYSKEEAKESFTRSLKELLAHGQEINVDLCIENNVIEGRNLIDGKNLIDLMTGPKDYAELMANPELTDLKFLVDVGHLKVSAVSEGFDPMEFMDVVAPRVHAFHLSENNGRLDQNLSIQEDSWFLPHLKHFPQATLVLEAYRLGGSEIHRNLELIEAALG